MVDSNNDNNLKEIYYNRILNSITCMMMLYLNGTIKKDLPLIDWCDDSFILYYIPASRLYIMWRNQCGHHHLARCGV